MTSEQEKEIEKLVEEAEKKQNEENTPKTKQSFLQRNAFLLEKVKQIVAIENKLYGKMAKTRKVVAAIAGAASGFFTGYEFMEMYNLFYDATLMGLYTENSLELTQMENELLKQGVPADQIHLPVFSDNVLAQLPDYGIDPTSSSSEVILNAMSSGVFDISNLDPTTGCVIAALVGLSVAFTGFEVNNFLKNKVRRDEQKKIAEGELPTFMQEEKAKEEQQAPKEKAPKEKAKDDFKL